jgi:cyclopropane fatty-acyl-phospholipid synthase-like methyltransferase
MKILKKLIRKILGKSFFYNNFYEIDSSLEGLTSILDLGCGNNSPYLRYWIKNNHQSIGVHLYANKSSTKNYKLIQKDVIDFVKSQPNKSFDAVLALDIIEHFVKSDALFLIKEIERIAKKKIIIVIPNVFWPGMLSGPGQVHLC